MDKNELAAQAKRYKEEMMKLYGKSVSVPANAYADDIQKAEPDGINIQPDAAEQKEASGQMNPEMPENNNVPRENAEKIQDREYPPQPMNETESVPGEDNGLVSESGIPDIDMPDDRFPEPDLSELEDIPAEQKLPVSENTLGTSDGYILVNVRTGDDSSPIKNAAVSVSAIRDGMRFFIGSDITDESGRTRRFTVPAPDLSLSLSPGSRLRPYGLYDVSVTAKGFFNARSVDVPVFSGITSLQNFSMIPVPQFMQANDETIVNYNQEPQL